MGFVNKIIYLGLGIFFLWLTITVPDISKLFLMDLSNLTDNQLLLLQYSFLTGYLASMMAMAVDQ